MIMLWSGSIASVPSGWQLCDGTNGTPNLRDRFVVGAGSTYAVNATGGSADAIVVSHTHTATSTVTDPGHFHTTTFRCTTKSGDGPSRIHGPEGTLSTPDSLNTDTKTTGITVATTNASTGSSGTNANLPPYYALAYIMKL
jgi:microcystin-dependent protein